MDDEESMKMEQEQSLLASTKKSIDPYSQSLAQPQNNLFVEDFS